MPQLLEEQYNPPRRVIRRTFIERRIGPTVPRVVVSWCYVDILQLGVVLSVSAMVAHILCMKTTSLIYTIMLTLHLLRYSLPIISSFNSLEIQYSNARQLRSQLREIAPMNDEGSKIFCPNGPSAAVSPLMENKCGDRQALPSVYGRSDDAMGNSIPGFTSAGRGGGGASAAQLRADLAAQSYFRSE